MHIADAQRQIRTTFNGGFWGQLVSSALWLTSAALATWSTPRAAIWTIVAGGFLIFPATSLLVRLSGGPSSPAKGNPLSNLGMQIALTLPMTMLLLVPVTRYHLNLFYPALLILLGAHYLPFVFLYGMRIFAALCALLVSSGVVIALYAPHSFALGAWVGGLTLLVFACIGRVAVQRELRAT